MKTLQQKLCYSWSKYPKPALLITIDRWANSCHCLTSFKQNTVWKCQFLKAIFQFPEDTGIYYACKFYAAMDIMYSKEFISECICWESRCSPFSAFASRRSCQLPSSLVWSLRNARCQNGLNGAHVPKHVSIWHPRKAIEQERGPLSSFLLAVKMSAQNWKKQSSVCHKEMEWLHVSRKYKHLPRFSALHRCKTQYPGILGGNMFTLLLFAVLG